MTIRAHSCSLCLSSAVGANSFKDPPRGRSAAWRLTITPPPRTIRTDPGREARMSPTLRFTSCEHMLCVSTAGCIHVCVRTRASVTDMDQSRPKATIEKKTATSAHRRTLPRVFVPPELADTRRQPSWLKNEANNMKCQTLQFLKVHGSRSP